MIPLLIINYNKHKCLLKSIKSYERLGNVDIHIIDNGSDYPELLQWYKDSKYKVHYFDKITDPNQLPDNVNNILNKLDYPFKYYIVTDSDVEIENPEPLIKRFILIHLTYNVEMVAPMLRINDLPQNKYTKEQIRRQTVQFWNKPRVLLRLPGCTQEAIPTVVDTTFAMFKDNFRFRRYGRGYRLFEPFMAKHLDWYDDIEHPSKEKMHYFNTASKCSSAKVSISELYPELIVKH